MYVRAAPLPLFFIFPPLKWRCMHIHAQTAVSIFQDGHVILEEDATVVTVPEETCSSMFQTTSSKEFT